jgi:hypothetical protein
VRLSAHGLHTDLPPGWEGAIRRPREHRMSALSAGPAVEGHDFAVAHLGNFRLPPDRGDFGSGAVDEMRADNAFVSLLEYGPECVGTPLFERRGLPRRLRPSQFSPKALQRTLPGQAGLQVFFTDNDRAFCLYVVLGSANRAGRLVPLVEQVLSTTRIDRR